MANERIVAVALLTQRDVEALGPTFARLWPVDETPCFSALLRAIDDADRELWRDRDRAGTGRGPVLQVDEIPKPTQPT